MLCCAAVWCADCSNFNMLNFGLAANDSAVFFSFSSLPSRSMCGVVDPGAKEFALPLCGKKKNSHKQRGKMCKRSCQVLQEPSFQESWEDHSEELEKFRMHLFQVRSN